MEGPDSPNNWIQIRLFYLTHNNPETFRSNMREVDVRVFQTGMNLEESELAETWHVRWDGSFIALRVRPNLGCHIKVKLRLDTLKSNLEEEKRIIDSKYDMKNFLQSENLPDDLASWEEWHTSMKILNLLSQIMIEVHSLEDWDRRRYMFYNKASHHLNNMAHIQDTFIPFLLREDVYDETINLLAKQDAEILVRIVSVLGKIMKKNRWFAKFHVGDVI